MSPYTYLMELRSSSRLIPNTNTIGFGTSNICLTRSSSSTENVGRHRFSISSMMKIRGCPVRFHGYFSWTISKLMLEPLARFLLRHPALGTASRRVFPPCRCRSKLSGSAVVALTATVNPVHYQGCSLLLLALRAIRLRPSFLKWPDSWPTIASNGMYRNSLS